MRKIALVLAGGKGTRLWPLSRENYPKQFVELDGGLSLFQMTLRRLLSFFSAGNIFVAVPEEYRFTVRNQIEFLPGLAQPVRQALKKNLILEPAAKGTLGAVLFSLKTLEERKTLKGRKPFCTCFLPITVWSRPRRLSEGLSGPRPF